MSRPKRPPSYRFHKARKCAVVTIHGKDHYLGPYGSADSHEAYARLITKWRAMIDSPPPDLSEDQSGDVTVNGVILKYLTFASGYYRKHDEPTDELKNIRAALSALKKLYGRTLAQAFGPKDLELVRNSMIDANLARKTINGRVSRIRRMFRWASKEGLVPAITYHGLLALDGLKFNRSKARETKRVMPVSEEHVDASLPHLNEHVRAMVQVQHLTGMRPQEVRNLRTCDIDTCERRTKKPAPPNSAARRRYFETPSTHCDDFERPGFRLAGTPSAAWTKRGRDPAARSIALGLRPHSLGVASIWQNGWPWYLIDDARTGHEDATTISSRSAC